MKSHSLGCALFMTLSGQKFREEIKSYEGATLHPSGREVIQETPTAQFHKWKQKPFCLETRKHNCFLFLCNKYHKRGCLKQHPLSHNLRGSGVLACGSQALHWGSHQTKPRLGPFSKLTGCCQKSVSCDYMTKALGDYPPESSGADHHQKTKVEVTFMRRWHVH